MISNTFALAMSYEVVRTGIVLFVGLVVAIGLHEFGHAATAVLLGDSTPRSPVRRAGQLDVLGQLMGTARGRTNRFTPNPLAHADPIGTIALPIAAQFLLPGAVLVGWGRPVPFNPNAPGRRVSRQKMEVLVSLSGPGMNLLQMMAYSLLLVVAVALGAHRSDHELVRSLVVDAYPGAAFGWLQLLVGLNAVLACFNLLPVPPLDGGHLLTTYLERTHRDWARWLQQYGIFVFLVLLPVLPYLLAPVQRATAAWTHWLVGLAGG